MSPRQAAIVHRLVARAMAKAMPPKSRCDRLSMAFPPQQPPEIKKVGCFLYAGAACV